MKQTALSGYSEILDEQSRKLKVHEKDINKFGNVPSLPTHLYENYVWQIQGVLLKVNDVWAQDCTGMI